MDNVDRFYLETVSGAVAGLFEPQGYDPALIDSDDRKYVDPIEFEAYIKSLPAQLWAPEFRNAYATIKNYANRIPNQEYIDALAMAITAVRTLAVTYCPQILEELEAQQPVTNIPKPVTNQVTNRVTKCTSATRPNLPAGVKDTPGARAAFDSLVTAGYLDSEYKPTASAAKNVICAYMAGTLNQLLGVDHWAKVFADFWGVPNLSQSFFQLNKAGKEYTADIDKALAAAARSCDQLAQTKRGKELLGKK